MLVTGGTTTGGAILASAELYDPSQNTWTLIAAPMIDALTGEPATALISTSSTPNTSVLLSGGTTSAAGATPPTAATADVEVFNLTNLSTLPFTFVGALPTARTNHVAAALQDGRVFIAGGTDANGNTLNTTAIYDPVAGTVSQGPNLNTPRANATATTLLDGTVLIAGGSYPEGAAANNNIAELNTAEIFNPAGNGTITPAAANLVQARAGQQAFLLPNNNNVLLVGGTYNGATLRLLRTLFALADHVYRYRNHAHSALQRHRRRALPPGRRPTAGLRRKQFAAQRAARSSQHRNGSQQRRALRLRDGGNRRQRLCARHAGRRHRHRLAGFENGCR